MSTRTAGFPDAQSPRGRETSDPEAGGGAKGTGVCALPVAGTPWAPTLAAGGLALHPSPVCSRRPAVGGSRQD